MSNTLDLGDNLDLETPTQGNAIGEVKVDGVARNPIKGVKRVRIVLEDNDTIPPTGQFIGVNGKGYILRPKFIFIDGRTGEQLHSETFREEVLYNANQSTPPLSSFFELMDRLLPSFLNTLSAQKVRGSRTLLK